MVEQYKEIALRLKNYPLFPEEYHYFIDEVNFTDDDIKPDKGPVFYDPRQDEIVIHMIFDLNISGHRSTLLNSVMHESTHRIKQKRDPKTFDGLEGHGPIFQALCVEFGLDPIGEIENKGVRNTELPFYQWAEEYDYAL